MVYCVMESLTEEQITFLNKVCKGKWEQSVKGIVVYGDVNMYNKNLNKIPVKFYKVNGHFDCCRNNLTSLKGCPEYVKRDFFCYHNKITSLEGCPEYVGGISYYCNNKITSLEGIGEVKGIIFCQYNKINYKKEKELRPEIYKKIYLRTLEKLLVES